MDGSRPKSSNAVAGANAAAAADRRESEARQSFSSSSNSNLDSFFKRLGQGQGSRLWAGAGQHQRSSSGAAVPGSLRTRVRAASTRADSKANVAAGAIADGVTGGSSNSGGDGNCKTAAESRHGSSTGIRRQRSAGGTDDRSLSPLGTSGSWRELEGGRRSSTGNTNRDGSDARSSHNHGQGRRPSSSRTLGSRTTPAGAAATGVAASFSPSRPRASTVTLTKDSGGGERPEGGDGNGLTRAHSERPPSPSPAVPPPPPPEQMSSPGGYSSPRAAAATAKGAKDTLPAPKPPTSPRPKSSELKYTPPPPIVSRPSYRDKRFDEVLQEDVVKLDQLRQLSWNGVPPCHRAAVWQLLVGYMPANRGRRAVALERKRREYREAVPQYFDVPDAARSYQEQDILRQILVDVPRTCPDVPFFHQEKVQRAMERILYIWAIRHPASGYVQGINDLMTPLYVVFLSAHVGASVESTDVSKVDEALLNEVEADVYWCLTKLVDNIQDHYTAMQPGLQRMVLRLEELVQRIDADLHRHITEEGLMYIQFAFRWMNCLLMRELPLRAVVRAWDTYLAEDNGFESFHVYVSAALICHFSSTLREMDFQSMVMFLQDMPTKEWGEEEVEPLLSQAYILSTLFERSPNHLNAT